MARGGYHIGGVVVSRWEPNTGQSDEWYTPAYIFDALGVFFDLDVAAPSDGPRHVPCRDWYSQEHDGLARPWSGGMVWMNPPFGKRNGLKPWLDRFFEHGNGIALTPDRTSAPWWQYAANHCDAMLFTRGKVKFERPDGTIGKSPSAGVTLWASGARAVIALLEAERRLGSVWTRAKGD